MVRAVGRFLVIWVTAVLALGFGAVAVPAAAHTELIGVDPHDGASLHKLPSEIRLEFSDDMDPRLSTVTLRAGDADGARLDLAKGVESTVLVASVPGTFAPEVGTTTRWVVTFRVVSRDGHPVSGSSTFVVRTPASETASPTESSAVAPTDVAPSAEPPSLDGDPGSTQARGPETADEPGTDGNSAWLVAIGVGVLALLALAVGTVMRLVGRDTET